MDPGTISTGSSKQQRRIRVDTGNTPKDEKIVLQNLLMSS